MKYSVVIPVYNRPDEVDELLASLVRQSFKDFEVIIVEDGSVVPCREIVEKYRDGLDVRYLWKENGGPSAARNMGVEECKGEYVLILDSDCVVPPGYMAAIEKELEARPCDAFGGPDRANAAFTPL